MRREGTHTKLGKESTHPLTGMVVVTTVNSPDEPSVSESKDKIVPRQNLDVRT